jgi:NRAMP (natural resistance-associated macrophage protein)-like metal ion transporter
VTKPLSKLKKFWHELGPGLITGAADDDPAGITTYSVAGAKFGLGTLWTVLLTLPFMVVIQRMAGRIGLISGRGLSGNMKRYYPRWILILTALAIIISNIINIGADISGIATASNLLMPKIPSILFSALVSGIIIVLLIFLSYRRLAKYLKWIAMVLFSYILAAFLVKNDWLQVFYRLFVPKFTFSRDYLFILTAIFGTTISPYLFFWQASEEVEEEKLHRQALADPAMIPDVEPHGPHRSPKIIKNEITSMYTDVRWGMFFSNLITFFIIVLAASTLFKSGTTNVQTIEQVASALRPLAGQYANLLFLVGILASGMLAVPVLAGSAAYALAEIFGWRLGFENAFTRAKQFYLVIIISTLLGIAIPALRVDPIKILLYTSAIYGAISPILILMVIHMANNPKIMGKYTSRLHSNIIAYLLFLIMSASTILTLIL